MSSLTAFLMTITWWQGYLSSYDSCAFPAQYLWDGMYRHRPSTVVDLSLVVVSYPTAVINMFVAPIVLLDEGMYLKPRQVMKSEISKTLGPLSQIPKGHQK